MPIKGWIEGAAHVEVELGSSELEVLIIAGIIVLRLE